MQFSEWLKEKMDEAGLTVKELADKGGMTTRSIFMYRSGKSVPKTATIAKLSSVLNADYDEAEGVFEQTKLAAMAEKSITSFAGSHGLTIGQYYLMLSDQNGSCAICGDALLDAKPMIDQSRKGHVRGLLCGNCYEAVRLLRIDEETNVVLRASLYAHRNHKARKWWAQKLTPTFS